MIIYYILMTGIFLLYIISGIVVYSGLKRFHAETLSDLPPVSVIVAARNEEEHIANCINSLLALDYPKEKIELIIVDDHSTDNTCQIVQSLAANEPRLVPISLGDYFENNSGKAGAIQFAVEKSRGEFIFVTDADCQVPKTWVKNLLSAFTPDMGLVGGVTLLDEPNEKMPIFGKIQSFDWLYLLTIATATGYYGIPISWFGNNMAFRRQTFDDIDGFKNLRNTLVEDFAFILKIHQSNKWNIRFIMHKDSLVKSSPLFKLRSYYNQRKRWATAIHAVHPCAKVLMFTTVCAHIATLVSLFFFHIWMALAGLFIMVLMDFIVTWRSTGFLGRRDLLKYILYFKGYFYYFTLIFPVMLVFDRKIDWKDRHYPIYYKAQS